MHSPTPLLLAILIGGGVLVVTLCCCCWCYACPCCPWYQSRKECRDLLLAMAIRGGQPSAAATAPYVALHP